MQIKLIASLTLLLSACSQYDVTINDRPVYTPPPLFTDYQFTDLNLRNCVAQTIDDQAIRSASALKQLNCADAGIQEVKGIAVFSQLRALNLRNNHLRTLGDIRLLGELETLIISNNQVEEASGILPLLKLQILDLDENAALACRELTQFASYSSAQIIAPKHCKSAMSGEH